MTLARLASIVALAVILSGCADESASDPLPQTTDDEVAPRLIEIFQDTLDWPTTPADTAIRTFDVPRNASVLYVYFNWRGMQPGGFSSSREALLVAPDGSETELVGGDLPANPYVCASATCGPPEDRLHDFDSGLAGTWTLELRGVYTATASLRAEILV